MEVQGTGTSLTEKPLKALCSIYIKGFLNYWHLVLENPLLGRENASCSLPNCSNQKCLGTPVTYIWKGTWSQTKKP